MRPPKGSVSLSGAALVLAGLPGKGTQEALSAYLSEGIRSFIFPASLLREPEALAKLCTLARREAQAFGPAPLLLALGGWDSPAPNFPSLPELPSPLGLAAVGDRRLARLAGFQLGRLASSCGIDLVFAPRLDLASDPKAPGGVLETFGEDPLLVSALALAWARGLEAGGVAACGTAFPGCGCLSPGVRKGPASLAFGADRLEDAELYPFFRASRHRLPALLAARVYVPAFEPERIPAARSAMIIEGRLRSSLGFRGLVIGDAVDEDPEGPARAAILGALAGCDLVLALDPSAVLATAKALKAAAAEGEVPAPRLALSAFRVSALLERLPSPMRRPRALALDASPLVQALGARASLRAATLLRSGPEGLAAPGPDLDVVVFLPPPSSPEASAIPAVLAVLEASLAPFASSGARLYSLPEDPGYVEAETFLADLGIRKDRHALVFSWDAHSRPSQESLIHVVEEFRASMSLVALRDPYDGAFFPKARALAAVYGFSALSVRAGLALASGRLRPSGSCPVAVLGLEV